MSESSESSWGMGSSESSVSSRYVSPPPPVAATTTTPKTKVSKTNFAKIRTNLKNIEVAISQTLSVEEKDIFIDVFRKLIVENEKQVIEFSNASFFIEKFRQYPTIHSFTLQLKEKIVKGLITYDNEQKQKDSKLKYW